MRTVRATIATAALCLLLVAAGGVVKPANAAANPFPATAAVTADFSASNGTGHSDVFGATLNFNEAPGKIDSLKQAGFTLLRKDAYLSQIVPNSTVANYRANVGNVQDPNTWDWSKYGWLDLYRSRGFRILLILSYDTTWLGYPNCNCGINSPPSAMDVYADIVKKIYQHFQGKVDLVEVWNEPDGGFLNTTGSPYPDQLTAYRDIYVTASNAVRSVDPNIPIGGPVTASPVNTSWATALFQDSRIPAGNIDFLSYHDYQPTSSEAVASWKNVAAAAGRGPDFPVYVTEWNHEAAFDHNPLHNDHPDAISYQANRLTNFYRLHANGTTYYAENDEVTNPDFFGVYVNGTMAPNSRTFRLLSTDLGLGAGDSTIRGVSFGSPLTNAAAATTAGGDQVAWVVNDGTGPINVTLNLIGLGGMTSANASVFEASANQAVGSPATIVPLTISGGNATVLVNAPPKSVVGVRLTPYQIAQEQNLAPAATVTASSSSPGLPAANVTDGIVGIHGAGEWGSNAELTPWVRLTWPSAQTVGRIVLFDRANLVDQIQAGTLSFSDGSSVPVPPLPNDGTGKAISFAPRSVTWVKFQVTSGSGDNVGLSEIQVQRGANIASRGAVSASSWMSAGTQPLKATDGIVGQATGEWASAEVNPWIQVTWINTRNITGVDLHDRIAGGRANAGTLTFSDGSSIAVSGIPTDGTAKSVSFPQKSVKWVRFQVTGGSGANVGLSEIQVTEAANLASSATATASSIYQNDPTFGPAAATDGIVNQWYSGEWGSNGELNPWIQLTWPSAQTVGRVVLYDRNNLIDAANGGTLTFSDGSSIAVSGIDNSGLGKVVVFPSRTVTSIRFQVSGGAGLNVGLSEFEAFST